MNAPNGKMKMRVLTVAVQGALFAMFALPAHAEDPDVAALTTPDNFVEIGVTNVSKGSAKFGEYTGLNNNGAELIGNFSVKGGDGYGPGEGTTRWSVSGRDLGLTSRELNASIVNQGRWNVGIGYDELRHNTTDGYQTPYAGSMGGNSFTLPASFAGNTANTTTLTAAQLASFHTVEVNNTRKNTSLDAGYIFSPEWRLTLDYNNLKQSGAKLMAFGSDATLGTLGSAGFSYTTNGGQRVSILPNPTNYTTDTVNLALDWTGDKGHASVGYFGSFFRDHYDRVSWETFGSNAAHQMNTMSTAPSNNLHQFNLSGGYRFSPETKLTGGLSRGRNTQNSSFLNTNLMFDATPLASRVALPADSLNGLVITTHADVKLVNQTTKDLKLAASVKYDKRDNRTQSNIYDFYAINGTGDRATYPNTPYSNSKTQIELAGDYRLTKNNKIRVAYNHDDTDRWCNNYAVNADYPAGTNCVVNTGTKEDKLSLGYKLKASDAVDFNAGYAYGVRKTTYDANARTAFIGVRGGTDIATGVQGTIKGLNGGDFLGFHPIFDASRKQHLLKAGANWQADAKLSFGVNARYSDDNYTDATYGAQNGNAWNLNLDATYNYSDEGSVFGFISQDYRDRYIKHVSRSNLTTNAYVWGDKLEDEGITYGLGFKQGGLMGGKLDLKGDLNISDAKTNYASEILSTFAGGTTTAATCAAATSMTCGSAPAIKNKLTQFKLTGTYKLDGQSKVAVGYLYQRLSSTDYFYNSYQYGYTATSVLPTNQQSGSYSVNMIAASYIYSFK
jgi:MtrB/PioB family decaheme-associated outer membrane protein